MVVLKSPKSLFYQYDTIGGKVWVSMMNIGDSFKTSWMKINCILLVSFLFPAIVNCHPLYHLNRDKLEHLAAINTPLNYIRDNFRIGDKAYATNKQTEKCCVEHEEPNVRENGKINISRKMLHSS